MTLEEVRKLRKNDRIIWECDGSGISPYLGTVVKKTVDNFTVKWDVEDDLETWFFEDGGDSYFECLTKVKR